MGRLLAAVTGAFTDALLWIMDAVLRWRLRRLQRFARRLGFECVAHDAWWDVRVILGDTLAYCNRSGGLLDPRRITAYWRITDSLAIARERLLTYTLRAP